MGFGQLALVVAEVELVAGKGPGHPVGGWRSAVADLGAGPRQLAAGQTRQPFGIADEPDGPARAPEITGRDRQVGVRSRVAAAHTGPLHGAAAHLEGSASDPKRPGPRRVVARVATRGGDLLVGELAAVHPIGEGRDRRRHWAEGPVAGDALGAAGRHVRRLGAGVLGGDRLEVTEQLGAGRVGGELVEHRTDLGAQASGAGQGWRRGSGRPGRRGSARPWPRRRGRRPRP